MKGQLSYRQYRRIDLTLFAVMLLAFESVIVMAAVRWFPGEPYMVSVTPVIAAIVMMRWGSWAAIHAFLGGAALYLISGAGKSQPILYAVYCLGNLGCLAGLIPLKKWGGEAVRNDTAKTLIFGAAVLLGMLTGRALVSLALIRNTGAIVFYFTPEAVTLLFTLVLMWIVRRIDGLFENQDHYLKRVHQQMLQEDAEEKGGFQ